MWRPSRPTPSMAVSITALVVALGGTSYAAATIGSNDVKNGSLRSADIRNGAVQSKDVKNGSLRGRDFRGGLPAGKTGPQGPTGATGPAGPTGPQGPAGPSRWVLVNAAGAIEAQSGGFTVKSGYVANPAGAAGNVYIDAGEDLTNKGIVATIALQNQVDQNGDMIMNGRAPGSDTNPEFSGEISATRCAITGVVSCAPTGTNTNTHFVVSPRLSDGQVTTEANRKRFYAVISG